MSERKLLFVMNAQQAEEFARQVAAAERGDGAAACRLGDWYREGLKGLRYSPKETFRWYSRSALAGDPNGRNNLGACYEHALGCAQSYPKAVKWYRLAEAQGLGTATMNLGYCYLRGHGVPADKAEALRLFRLAVERGEDKAAKEVERLEGDRDVVKVTGLSTGPRPAGVAACPGGHAVDPATLRSQLRCGPADSSLSRRSSQCDSPVEARSQSLRDGSCLCGDPSRHVNVPAFDAVRLTLLRDGPPEQLRHSQAAPTELPTGTPDRESPTSERPVEPSVARGERDGQKSAGKDGRPRIRYVTGTEAGKHIGLIGVVRAGTPERDASDVKGPCTDR